MGSGAGLVQPTWHGHALRVIACNDPAATAFRFDLNHALLSAIPAACAHAL
jgi:hypothetical protein